MSLAVALAVFLATSATKNLRSRIGPAHAYLLMLGELLTGRRRSVPMEANLLDEVLRRERTSMNKKRKGSIPASKPILLSSLLQDDLQVVPVEEVPPTVPLVTVVDEKQVEEFDVMRFLSDELDEQQDGEWISASALRPLRARRTSSSSTHELACRQQQREKLGDGQPTKLSRARSGDGKTCSKTAVAKRSVQTMVSTSKPMEAEGKSSAAHSSTVKAAAIPSRVWDSSRPDQIDKPRTPSPTDVTRPAVSPAKILTTSTTTIDPFAHIKVTRAAASWSVSAPAPWVDEDISDCSDSTNSHNSPNNMTFDHENALPPPQQYKADLLQPQQVLHGGYHAPQLPLPMVVPVPLFYLPVSQPFPVGAPYDLYPHHAALEQLPPPVVPLLYAVRLQIEYYFSAENLCRDRYLRDMMDGEGWVNLGVICKFNRMRSFNAPPLLVSPHVIDISDVHIDNMSSLPDRSSRP
jgi:hypothetical protein